MICFLPGERQMKLIEAYFPLSHGVPQAGARFAVEDGGIEESLARMGKSMKERESRSDPNPS